MMASRIGYSRSDLDTMIIGNGQWEPYCVELEPSGLIVINHRLRNPMSTDDSLLFNVHNQGYEDWFYKKSTLEKASSDRCWELKGFIPESGPSGGCMVRTAKSERTRAERKRKKKAMNKSRSKNR